MLGPLGHLASLLAFAARKSTRLRDDHAAQRELAWPRAADDLPPGLELAWLGTAGFRLSYAGHHLLIDPYVTRLSLGDLLRRRVVTADLDRLAALPDPIAIAVGHTHFDHALDVPALAARAGCPVLGGRSLANLMAAHGRRDLAVEVVPDRRYEYGPFTLTFVPSRHARLAAGLWTPYDGELTCAHTDELVPQRYRCGAVWGIHVAVAGVTFYHQGSCDLDDDALGHRPVDYLLCGIVGRRYTERYWARLLARVEPRVIIPHHYDNFLRPLAEPLALSLNVDLAGLPDEIARVSRDFELRALTPGQVVGRA